MRSDPEKMVGFAEDESWGNVEMKLFERTKARKDGEPAFRSTPFSGNERNRLFLQRQGNFEDVSLLSGVDFREDGRGFVVFDFDRDGWQDIGVVSPNFPRFRIVKNEMGQRSSKNRFVEVNLVGGQTTTQPSTQWSSRDPFGATLLVNVAGTKRMFQLSASEGLSSQNSRWIHIGLGDHDHVDLIEVMWPSGKSSSVTGVKAGQRITILEREPESTGGSQD